MAERYGPKGFTRTKVVRDILASHEKPSRSANYRRVRFEGLPASAAARLLAKLPEAQQDDSVDATAPNFRTLVEVGLQVPGAALGGYRVDSGHPRERITLTRITIPNDSRTTETLDALVSALPEHKHRLQISSDGSAFIDWEPTS